MPAMGADMTEGTVAKWIRKEGDTVKRGEKLAEIETDKTVVEMEAYADGTLLKIVVPEGRKVPVGQLIAWLGQSGEKVPEDSGAPAGPIGPAARPPPPPPAVATPAPVAAPSRAAVAEPAPARMPTAAVAAAASPATEGERVKASPMARKLAEERGIDLSRVPATGPGGRITRDDVLNFKPAPPTPGAGTARTAPKVVSADIPLTSMRQAIARVTVRSKTEAPHFYITVAVDMTDTMRFRQRLNEALAESGARVSVNDMIVKACCAALLKHPKFNTSFAGDRLAGHADINIGIAIALEQGLIVPALLRCQGKSLVELSAMAKDLGDRTRGKGGPLTQQEMTAGTFAISNLGMFDVESFAAIIVPPHAAVLATGTVTKTPVVKGGEIAVADVMKATLSCDHRVADGAEAAVFITEIKRQLENPALLMM
jgi:pyruvate dehydrogenase E2 component (dihydrolipoamide acetyltransferase)